MRDRQKLRVAIAKALRGEGWPLDWDETSAPRRRAWLDLADTALDTIEKEERRMKLIPGWKHCWKLWSVRLHALASSILLLFAVAPSMPGEMANVIPAPARVFAVAAWAALGLYARLAKQK